jgi:hypothetical protein
MKDYFYCFIIPSFISQAQIHEISVLQMSPIGDVGSTTISLNEDAFEFFCISGIKVLAIHWRSFVHSSKIGDDDKSKAPSRRQRNYDFEKTL